MTLAQALRDIEARKAEHAASIDAVKAAIAARTAAEVAQGVAARALHNAEVVAAVIRGNAWIAKHPDDVETVRAGTDWPRLAQLKLGKQKVSRGGWRTYRSFDWNTTGDDVRAALSQMVKEPTP